MVGPASFMTESGQHDLLGRCSRGQGSRERSPVFGERTPATGLAAERRDDRPVVQATLLPGPRRSRAFQSDPSLMHILLPTSIVYI